MKRQAIVSAFVFITIAIGFAMPRSAATGADTAFGHEVPPFKEVFTRLFKSHAEVMSLDQLRTVSTQLTDKERAAISYFLGEEGHIKVKEGLDMEKQDFLDDKYRVHSETAPPDDFAKLFPHILAVANNNLTLEQLDKTLDALGEEDIASQSFYLGEEGRKQFFTELSEDRVERIMNHTADWVFLETGKRKYDKIKTYSCICYKQERIGGELQGVEKILLKFRDKPHGIYMKWIDGPWKGRELLYSEKFLGTGKVRVRESGILGVIPVTLPVDHEIAKRGSNHMATEIGLKNLIDMIEFDYRKAAPRNEIKRKNHGIVEIDGRKVFKMESILPKDKSKGYYCYRMVHYIDYKRSLEIKAEVYDFDDNLYESYLYTQIKINPGLTDTDFDPENPDYDID